MIGLDFGYLQITDEFGRKGKIDDCSYDIKKEVREKEEILLMMWPQNNCMQDNRDAGAMPGSMIWYVFYHIMYL